MSIIVNFADYLDLLNDTVHTNDTHVVNPMTLSCNRNKDPTVALTLCLILIAIFFLAIPGNLLVGWVVGTSRQTLTPSDVYLFHLTIADGLMALTIPFWAVEVIQGWIFGGFMCKILNLIIEANFYTSILFLACISIDRYVVIVHASDSLRRRRERCSWYLCAAVWSYGWALALPALFKDAFKPYADSQRMACSEIIDIGSTSSWRLATHAFRYIFGFFLPLGVMLVFYIITITRLLRTRGFQKYRAMKVIIAVMIAFLLCWAPYHITMMVHTVLRADLIPFDCAMRKSVDMALDVTTSLALLHSCINPVVYAFVAEKFRRKIMLLFVKKVRQEWMLGSNFSRSTSQTSEGNTGVL